MRGILFRQEMIIAIVKGGKTVTRRVMKPQPFIRDGVIRWTPRKGIDINLIDHPDLAIPFARLKVGEVVYIKEAWATEYLYNHLKPSQIPRTAKIWYASDGVGEWPINIPIGRLRSPLFMMEWMARGFLRITDVRAERLQEITPEDCKAEGIGSTMPYQGFRYRYRVLWDSINKNQKWDTNPFVWRYSFIKVDKEGGF